MSMEDGNRRKTPHGDVEFPQTGPESDSIINRRAFLAGTVFGGIGATVGAQVGIRDAMRSQISAETIHEHVFTSSFVNELKAETGASDADIAKLELDLIIHAKERLHTLLK